MKQRRSAAAFWSNQVDAVAGGETKAKLGGGGGAQGQRCRKEEEEVKETKEKREGPMVLLIRRTDKRHVRKSRSWKWIVSKDVTSRVERSLIKGILGFNG